MEKRQAILIVEDDEEDCEILSEALVANGYDSDVFCFQSPAEALDYLKSDHDDPFLIISDINMPLINGLDFKKQINSDERLFKKCIPFVFFSTSSSAKLVNEAYQLFIQGYFQKPDDVKTMKFVAKSIVEYWKSAKHPSLKPS